MSLQRALFIGTRGSLLARTQADLVRAMILRQYPSAFVETEIITTKGDMIVDRPIAAVGDSALFVSAIEDELRGHAIDLAVHSAKDLPTDIPADMAIVAFPERADARDAVVSAHGDLSQLPGGAVIGTSSARRTAQIRAVRPDLVFRDIRGNIDTRLRKLEADEYDAIILAMAGLERLGLVDERMTPLPTDVLVPAPGQGALAIEVRRDDEELVPAMAALTHAPTELAVRAERAFLTAAGGGCNSPIGAYAVVESQTITLAACIGALDGRTVRGSKSGDVDEWLQIAADLAQELLSEGGTDLLRASREP